MNGWNLMREWPDSTGIPQGKISGPYPSLTAVQREIRELPAEVREWVYAEPEPNEEETN